ncbi:MAG: AI-2E family transporter [Candidatus Cloacimonetes bacterium HGW-Cloacimonetes-1]|jgi:predicted PurR-regulated permease PerM|nr:MAG: AI-2E family transporter [Candidatus Cloacimonetes bacterium HGW-Cloacimonetes-1]
MEKVVKEVRWIRLLLTIIALPIIVIILKTLKDIFVPLIFAMFLSFLFAPAIDYLRKKKLPLSIIIAIMVVSIFLFIALISGIVYASAITFLAEFPAYHQKLIMILESSLLKFDDLIASLDLSFSGFQLLEAKDLFGATGFTMTKVISGTMGTFVDASIKLFLTMFFLIFMVAETGKLEKRLKKVLTEDDKRKTWITLLSIENQIQKYLFNKTLISLGTAGMGMLFMLIFGVDFVIIAGIMLFVLNFIPNIGSIAASGFIIMISTVNYGLGWRTIGVTLAMIFTQTLFANILEPKLMGKKLNLTPIMVLVSLVFWGWVWGIVGMVIAVPLTSAINIIIQQFDENNVVSAIISGS